MAYQEHPVFEKPGNQNAKIWRYMDFTKFMYLLDNQALFFARSDKLGDPFEGSYSRANEALRPVVYKDKIPKELIREMTNFNKRLRMYTFISCWHMNEYESDAMWKLYLKSGEGIAVQSTYQRLTESFNQAPENIYIGTVSYVNYYREWIPEGCTFYPYLHKRKEFQHEKELRAVICNLPSKGGAIDFSVLPPDVGIDVVMPLESLIEKIYIAPTAPPWIADLLRSILTKYNLKKEVIQSSLCDFPVF